jgi:curli biogenesis system outer membrane secretion channel CsgG
MTRQLTIKALAVISILILGGCASESFRVVETPQVASAGRTYSGEKVAVSIGKFGNSSTYMRGIFSDGVDRLGTQAKTVLTSHLQQSGRFLVMDRSNLEENKFEASLKAEGQHLVGASYIITGDITEFGRKEVGDHQLFGILGQGKKQIAYSKITLNVVDVVASTVVFSANGAGEYALSNREVIGFGGTASYDSTLNGKVIDLAMRQAVDELVAGMENGKWGKATLKGDAQ